MRFIECRYVDILTIYIGAIYGKYRSEYRVRFCVVYRLRVDLNRERNRGVVWGFWMGLRVSIGW